VNDRKTVLVLTNSTDLTANAVIYELEARGTSVVRCDLADFPLSLSMGVSLQNDGWDGALYSSTESLNVADIRSVYYRRPAPFRLPQGLTEDASIFAQLEARAGFLGVLASLRCRWMNPPAKEIAAAYKPVQLAHAASLGLRPPASLITNDPAKVREFISLIGPPVLYKGIGRDLASDPAMVPAAATRIVLEDEIDDSIRMTAHLFQEFLTKSHEVRVTVVGRQMLAVEIHASSDAARLDWRTDYDSLSYRITAVPEDVRSRIIALMDRFGLIFSALDFVVTPEGEWRFLELNPNGQWLWLASETGLPVAEAIAEELTLPLG
jgi:ATP-grasp ribosomal peptide maturase